MTRHLAVDLGAESGRCVIATLDEGRLALEELCRFPTQGMVLGGGIHWNVYRFYEEILSAFKLYARRYGPGLNSVGVDTWGCDYALLDERDQLLELPYCYRDSRTNCTPEALAPLKPLIYEKTGAQFLTFATVNQLIASGQQAGGTLRKARAMLFIGDFLHFLMGADKVNEYTVASISQLVDTREKCWDDELFGKLGLPRGICQRLVHPGDCIGEVSPAVLTETGLTSPVKIIAPAVHDTASAILASPADGENWGYISSGTWSLAGVELDHAVNTPEALQINASNSGGALGRNLFLKNVMGLWLIQQCRKNWCASGIELSYEEIVEKAGQAAGFEAFIDPDDAGFFAPADMVEQIRGYLQKTRQVAPGRGDVGALARIVYESLALKYRYVFERLCAVSEKRVDVLHIIGGGSRNDMLNRMTAGVMGVPVVAGPAEATAIGNVLMQAYGCGQVQTLQEIRGIVALSFETRRFLPEDTSAWEDAYRRFRRVTTLD